MLAQSKRCNIHLAGIMVSSSPYTPLPKLQPPTPAEPYGALPPPPDITYLGKTTPAGTTVLDWLEFPKQTVTLYRSPTGGDSPRVVEETIGRLQLLSPVLTLSRAKNIVATPLNRTTDIQTVAPVFHEFISNGPWQGTIRGVLQSDRLDQYPEQEVQLWERISSLPVPLEVVCPVLNERGIRWIIIQGQDPISPSREDTVYPVLFRWEQHIPITLTIKPQ
jgi:hypothetical protein